MARVAVTVFSVGGADTKKKQDTSAFCKERGSAALLVKRRTAVILWIKMGNKESCMDGSIHM